MFTFLTPTPDTAFHDRAMVNRKVTNHRRQKSTLLATMLAGTLLLSACQPQTESTTENSTPKTTEQQQTDANKPIVQSDSAAARIAQFQPLYVTQMQGLQRRLQAEYASLEAADAADIGNVSLAPHADGSSPETDSNAKAQATIASPKTDSEINTSTEVGERDLEVLKRLSLEPREPKILTEAQIIKSYQHALQALYQPASEALSAQDADTLLNIATLIPQLFEHSEIAERLTIKSPALGRLIIQHQVWQQIEVQQALDMQQMKRSQQQEFEGLMSKFDETIKGYDEQIAKYEQTLKEFK
ncbi:hypothetical protein [Psychrobacter urativorans]|uniref:Uncharacterized protein n=1 Tax=Psychrobacter urativorans TaxID=45610 RepID=A0A0M4T2I8_9GAMM|nr:hypothetical protein [Psychrobacter urativorans]ALF59802.1 hypothetical protein AOC03_06935 [Psychrobacter urativorans]